MFKCQRFPLKADNNIIFVNQGPLFLTWFNLDPSMDK